MKSNLYEKVQRKVKSWSKGFKDENRSFMYDDCYKNIEGFLKEPKKEKMDFIVLGGTCNMLSAWYGADFLERYLNKDNNYAYSLKQSMLWGAVDFLLYEAGKKGDIEPVWYVEMCLSACNMLILQKMDEAHKLFEYTALNKSAEISESVCQFIIKMYSEFYKDNEIIYEFSKPLNDVYKELLDGLLDETKLDINDSINKACEFHLSRIKLDQEFDTEIKMLLPSEILAPLLLKKRVTTDMKNPEHPLVKDLFPVIENLVEVETDPMFLKTIKEINLYKLVKLNNGNLYYIKDKNSKLD